MVFRGLPAAIPPSTTAVSAVSTLPTISEKFQYVADSTNANESILRIIIVSRRRSANELVQCSCVIRDTDETHQVAVVVVERRGVGDHEEALPRLVLHGEPALPAFAGENVADDGVQRRDVVGTGDQPRDVLPDCFG